MPLVTKKTTKRKEYTCTYPLHSELVSSVRTLPPEAFYNKTDGMCKTCKKHQITTRRHEKQLKAFDKMFPQDIIQRYSIDLIRCPFKHKPNRVLAEAILYWDALSTYGIVEYYPKSNTPRPVLKTGKYLHYVYSTSNYETMGEVLFLPSTYVPLIYVYDINDVVRYRLLSFKARVDCLIQTINTETYEITRLC